MRRVLDVVLVLLALASLGYGATVLGHAVTHESNNGLAGSSGTAQTSTNGARTASSGRSTTRRLQIRVAVIIVTAAVAIAVFLTVMSAFLRNRRRPGPTYQRRRR